MITLINKGIPNLWCNHDFFPYPQKSHVRVGGREKVGEERESKSTMRDSLYIASHPKVSSLDMSVTFLYLYHMVLFFKFFYCLFKNLTSCTPSLSPSSLPMSASHPCDLLPPKEKRKSFYVDHIFTGVWSDS